MESVKLILTCLDLPPLFKEQKFELKKNTILNFNDDDQALNSDQTLTIKIPFHPEQYGELNFPDIQADAWYIPYLKEAVVRKIITGYQDNTIQPANQVSKAELFAILYRITPNDILNKFTVDTNLKVNDLDPNQWFYSSAMFAIQNQLTKINDKQEYNYGAKLNRADFIQALYKYDLWLTKELNPVQEVIKEVKIIKEVETPTETPTNNTEDPATETNQTKKTTNTNDSETQGNTATEEGIASFYSPNLKGAKTASGENYDPEQLTAAHKTLPFGTLVKVENTENGKWVKVRINDRGPYVEGRIIDLSTTAFEAIAPLSRGLAPVKINVES